MTIEFLPVVLPSSTGPLVNGKLTPCQLTSVFFPGVGHLSLHPITARAWNAMAIAVHAELKKTLSTTGTYRPYDAQVQVFQQRYTSTYVPGRNVLTNKRVWNGKTFYLRRGMSPVAVPGTSNHGYGIAIDTAWWVGAGKPVTNITSDAAGWQWMQDNAVAFGFSWEGAHPGQPGWEPWHLRYVLGDKVSPRVTSVEKKLGIKNG